MPQGHPQRRLSQKRRLLVKHRLLKQNLHSKKYAIASWNLRRLGQGGWGETSWLNMKMVTTLALKRRWRAVLVTDCWADAPGTFEFKGPGGKWLLVFNCRSGVLLDPGMARMWDRGGRVRHDPPMGERLVWLFLVEGGV